MTLPLGAHDFPFLYSEQARALFSLPYAWYAQSHDGLGVTTLSTLWTWVYGLIFGLGSVLNIDFSLLVIIVGIVPILVAGWLSIGRLIDSLGISGPAKRVGQLLFISNTYLLMLIDGGQLSIALAAILLPLAVLYFPSRLKFILSISAISFLDIRFVYLAFMLVGIKQLLNPRQIRLYVANCLLAAVVVLGLHSYWILPSFFTDAPSLPGTYTRPSQIDFLSFASISHALFLFQPHWPENIFGRTSSPPAVFFMLPILAFAAGIVRPRNKYIAYWLLVSLVALFLIKGGNPPIVNLYAWLFSHVPGFSLFRDPLKFFPFLTLAYAVLISFTVDWLNSKFKYSAAIISVYLLALLWPVFSGQATGLFSFSRSAQNYKDLAEYLEKDQSSGSLVWVPSKPPLGFSSPAHPSIDAKTLIDRRPFATGIIGKYDLLNFLRDASYSGQLLDISQVKYLAIAARDPKRDSDKPEDIEYHQIFTNQLSTLPWVKQRKDFGPVTLLETQSHQDTFFIPETVSFVVGSDDIYRENKPLSKKSYIFVEEKPDLLKTISRFPNTDVLLNHKQELDVAAALLPSNRFVFPGLSLDFSPNHTGWWKRETSDFVSWRDFLQQKYELDNQDFDYGGGWAVSEGDHSLAVDIPSCSGSCSLLARLMVGPTGGTMSFSTPNGPIGDTITLNQNLGTVVINQAGATAGEYQNFTYNRANISWFNVGQLNGPGPVTIKTTGKINVLNALTVVSEAELKALISEARELISRSAIPIQLAQISYTKHNPTHYTLTVNGLSGPAAVIFSQNYNPLWTLNGSSAVPINCFLNGFPLPGSGQYEVFFTPQKYVLPGLVVSVGTLLGLTYFIIKPKLNQWQKH